MNFSRRNSEAANAWATKRRESQERARQLKDHRKRAAAPSAIQAEHPRYLAATSHEDNATYMDDFRDAFASMYNQLEGSGAASTLTEAEHRKEQNERHRRGADYGQGSGIVLAKQLIRSERQEEVGLRWYHGPVDPAGKLVDLSDRNIMCLSVHGDEAVFGCADHALYCVSQETGQLTRKLHSRRGGHREWVTAVTHTALGDVVSAGMDGKLCLWPGRDKGLLADGEKGSRSRPCSPLHQTQGHQGSISALHSDVEGRIASCGYSADTIRVWDCRDQGYTGGGSGLNLIGELASRALTAPCMEFAWAGDYLLTGHRDGHLGLWDLRVGQLAAGGSEVRSSPRHSGHVTVVRHLTDPPGGARPGSLFATGGQDGWVRIWDARKGLLEGGAVLEVGAHRREGGVGAVGGLMEVGGGGRLATFGADRSVCILQMRGGSGGNGGSGERWGGSGDMGARSGGGGGDVVLEHRFCDHRDFIYCMDFIPQG
ncbi:unnamed protein product, partial [Discosporangium mesarthrocarpum]